MSQKLRIAWLKTGPLHPLDTGGKLRTYNMLRELRKNHTITYIALCPAGTDAAVKQAAAEYSDAQIWLPWHEVPKNSPAFFFQLAKNFFAAHTPYTIDRYRSPAMTSAVDSLDRAGKLDLIICDFLTPAVNLLAGGNRPATPTLLFQHNVESLIWQRLYEQAVGWPRRFYFRQQWRRMRRFERQVGEQFDGVVAVSEEECRLFAADFGWKNVLGAVPTGVDTGYFQPTTETRLPQSMVFLGSMDWMPNIDAAVFFTDEMLPSLRRDFPQASVSIVGRNPTARVVELAARVPGIHVTGTVADVRPHLARAEVMVVPLRVGGGTRIKIYEGMATGIPVVSTRIGAEGLPVTHDENILLADSPEEFCRQTSRLFQDPALRERIGRNGLDFVRQHYGWASVNRVFEGYCTAAAARRLQAA